MRSGEVEYAGSDSVERLQRIQALCSHDDASERPDAVLIIGGIDSFHSQASQAVLKYLFLGSSGQELLGEQVISHEHERLEDAILLITRERISIFYSSESEAAVKVLPVISKWRHVTEYVVHDGMEPDEQEARKISAFKSMVAGVKRVGIPFGLDSDGKNLQDAMLPEKWPLIQSYGLESTGGDTAKGFFTMNHDVVNVSSELMHVMEQLDTFSAKRIVQESEPFLTHHFQEFLRKLDHAESPEVRSKKSESDMGEDLLSFYEFGTMQYNARGLQVLPTRGSRVLFGTRTSSLATKSSPEAFLSNSGVTENVSAAHMLVQAEDPFTGVRFARTYFLSAGKVCRKVVDEDALVHTPILDEEAGGSVAEAAKDTHALIELYTLLFQTFKAGTAKLVNDLQSRDPLPLKQCVTVARASSVQAMAVAARAKSDAVSPAMLTEGFFESRLQLTAELLDACGKSVNDCHQDWCLLYCSMQLAGIPSEIEPTKTLGSLTVGDTFLFRGQQRVPTSTNTGALSVTKPFAYFRSWAQHGEEAAAVRALTRALQSDFMLQSPSVRLGKAVTLLEPDTSISDDTEDGEDGSEPSTSRLAFTKATLLLESEVLPLLQGNWRVFTEGFLFICPHLNPIMVSFSRNVTSLHILPSEHEELMLLKIELKEDELSHMTPLSEALPFALPSTALYIPLQSGTRFQEEVLRILTVWKTNATNLDIPIYRPNDLSDKFEGDTPREGEDDHFAVPAIIKSACDRLVQKRRFVGPDVGVIDGLFPQVFIPKDRSPNTTLIKPNNLDLSKLCVPITILLGVPGSDTLAISRSICEIASASADWARVEIDLRELNLTKELKTEASAFVEITSRLAGAMDTIKASAHDMKLHPRILLAIVGFVDTITIASAVLHAAQGAPVASKLSAVIACVSATSVYLPDPLGVQAPFPKLFDQLTAGFTTHIVLTNSVDVAPAQLHRLRFHIDETNPFADVMVLSRTVFEGPLTPLLAVDRFQSVYYKQYRQMYFPNWDDASSNNATSECTPFVAEIDPEFTPTTLRFEIVPGMDRAKFGLLVIRALTPFATLAKSLDKIYPVETAHSKQSKGIRIAQSLAVEKVRQGAYSGDSTVGTSPGDHSGSCWCVEGQVVFKDEPGSVYAYRSTGTHAQLWLASVLHDDKTVPSLELKITGRSLDADKLHDLLLGCYARAEASPHQMRSGTDTTLEEKREIQRQHALDPLPDGYLFDGSTYVDFFGGRYEFHPNIAQFIAEHIAAQNDDTKATNLRAAEERELQKAFVRQLV